MRMPELEHCLFIVTGSTLPAEVAQRPIAYALKAKLERLAADEDPSPLAVVVCGDIWYLNTPLCRSRPTISIGPPDANALTAYLADRLSSVGDHEPNSIILMDPTMNDLVAACWGDTDAATASSIKRFGERIAPHFITECLNRLAPDH
jgi:hypothetical protein